MRKSLLLLFTLVSSCMVGCQTLQSDMDRPSVDVVGIQKLAPLTDFLLQLKITNPNEEVLKLSGLFYRLSIEGIEMAQGTTDQIPEIEAFSSQTISVESSASLVNAARLASLMINQKSSELDYIIDVKFGSAMPGQKVVRIKRSGTLTL